MELLRIIAAGLVTRLLCRTLKFTGLVAWSLTFVIAWMLLPTLWHTALASLQTIDLGAWPLAAAGLAGFVVIVVAYVRFRSSRDAYLKFTAAPKAGRKIRLEE